MALAILMDFWWKPAVIWAHPMLCSDYLRIYSLWQKLTLMTGWRHLPCSHVWFPGPGSLHLACPRADLSPQTLLCWAASSGSFCTKELLLLPGSTLLINTSAPDPTA